MRVWATAIMGSSRVAISKMPIHRVVSINNVLTWIYIAMGLANEVVMHTVFHTRQFKAGNSHAVRLPVHLAFLPDTELTLTRIGEKIIVEPKAETLDGLVNFLCDVGRRHDGWRDGLEIPERECA